MRFVRILCLLILPVYIFSCRTQQKLPNYIQNVTDSNGHGTVSVPDLRIQKNDLLSIQVYSISTRPDISDIMFNLPQSTGGVNTNGFLVDANGNIEFPRLGSFHAEGLTKQELATQIKKRLTEPVELLKDPTVIIRFQNYKITVIGQVGHEGLVTYPGERLTILEAIGLAGGITDYGQKAKVRVIRETNGVREIGLIDLSSKDLFDSPYYNLVQNDVVLVDPVKQKAKQNDQAVVAQRITFALSLITTAAFLFNLFR